jgi:hypothetical protein
MQKLESRQSQGEKQGESKVQSNAKDTKKDIADGRSKPTENKPKGQRI